MCQTVFYVPHEISGIPVFGIGWLFMCWTVVCVVMLARLLRRHGVGLRTRSYVPCVLFVTFVICSLPLSATMSPMGVPIRGYALMLSTGFFASLVLAKYFGRRVGLEYDVIAYLILWMTATATMFSRLFFVVQYREAFQAETLSTAITEITADSGQIVYGSMVGASIALVVFARRRKIRVRRLADIFAPCALVAITFGRIGCLLNGCCYGAPTQGPIALRFPMGSVPYQDQLSHGLVHGIYVAAPQAGSPPIITHVAAGSAAAAAGIREGASVHVIDGNPVLTLDDVHHAFLSGSRAISLELSDGNVYQWAVDGLPSSSLPVHPSQAYYSVNAILLLALLWLVFRLCDHDGVVFGIFLASYPTTRLLVEFTRPAYMEAGLSSDQLLCIALLSLAPAYWFYMWRHPSLRRVVSE